MTVSLDFFRLFLAAAGVTLGGCVLSIVAALNPANVAASMTPSHALRSNV
jgi:ABC-type lipoprotein release transport system permease subunit